MYQSKTDSSRKFGSAMRGRKFDSYHAEAQPEESATPTEHGGDKANLEGADKHVVNESSEQVSTPEPHAVAEEHGPATDVHIEHDHAKGEHKVTSTHEDGHKHESVHSSAAEAYEAGGALANTDVKRREHPDQQGAQAEEDGFEMPDLA